MAEDKLNVVSDFGVASSIDFVNRFSTQVDQLAKILGVSDVSQVPLNSVLKVYDWTAELGTPQVAEGETIPLSKANRVRRQIQMTLEKYRRSVSVEAIATYGPDVAINKANAKIANEIGKHIRDGLVTTLSEGAQKATGATLQDAIAQGWAQLQAIDEFQGSAFVAFVNPQDAADYLGGKHGANVGADATGALGMTLLQNFLGLATIVTMNEIPAGHVYVTAVENLNLVSVDLSGLGLQSMYDNFTTDSRGIIAMAIQGRTENATAETLFLNDLAMFAEIANGVSDVTITPATTTTTSTTTSKA